MKTDELRKLYLAFFKSKGHEVVESDSLVPKDDPSLLFTGAGMNQFKEQFLGRKVTYRRATTCQKCLRTGDLENVGRTPRHHTFFEMLGNFSFGDYFKHEAIAWAWEFFTRELAIPADRLWASVYKDDAEAYGIWKDAIKLPERRIIRFGEKDNFWPSEAPSKGPNGPCGPCSEIFYDYGTDTGCGKPDCTPACDCGRFVEVWNLVFTQFDRQPDGSLAALPSKNIDTGMGLERLASVMQGVKTNFEIDIFAPITAAIERESRTTDDGIRTTKRRSRINAIADHIRAVVFMIADGVMPSNEERGYVARKLIRRSMTHAADLGIKGPFLYKLVTPVVDAMKEQYPHLLDQREEIAQVVKREEENFAVVIATQLPKVEEAFEKVKASGGPEAVPELAFNFYDTYGMPYDMLEEVAEKHGIRIDEGAFEKLLEAQREKSRAKSKITGEIFSETFAKKVESLGLETAFLGYDETAAEARILAVLDGGEVILDRTPFYGESGGQAGDVGSIETDTAVMRVEDAKKFGGAIVHIGRMLRGSFAAGETARAAIDVETRKKVMANHTATHLLQAALRKVLGDHVKQTGSAVDRERLRFDFTHMKKMEAREIEHVERIVNDAVAQALPVRKEVKDIDTAKREGATALFGEKYDKTVRVISVGALSKELCGGTHVDTTGAIGLFRITGESSIASGVRRIEAVTGAAAEAWVAKRKDADAEKARMEREKDEAAKVQQKKLADELTRVDAYIAQGALCGGTRIVASGTGDLGMEGLRTLGDRIRAKAGSCVVILAAKREDKASFIVALSDDLVKKGIAAGALCKDLAALIDGSGGGKPHFAQGGGKSPDKLEGALAKVVDSLKATLG